MAEMTRLNVIYTLTFLHIHYTFDRRKTNNGIRGWKKRQSNFKIIGRMYSVSPSNIELFHLRLLICNVRGAQSFEDLRTVNGQLCSTFTDACKERGLIGDDYEWYRAMSEGEVWMMPQALRQLYAYILINCQPLYPDKLWDEFKISMSDDFRRKMTPAAAENTALSEIEKILNDEDKTLADYNNMPEILDVNENMEEEINLTQILAKGTEQYGKLNNEQKAIVDEIIANIENINTEDRCTCFYINGPGGSGKTFIYNTLWHLLIGEGKKVMTMAFTGIAATLLPKGKTVHKTFALPVPLYQDSTSNIKLNSKRARELLETDVFVWDEAPMAPKYCSDVIDRLLRDITDNDGIFGGKMLILGGDFRQLLPVLVGGTRSETVSLSIKYSQLWKFFRIFTLTQNMRTLETEKDFSNYLIKMGNGTLNDKNDNLELPENCVANKNEDIVIETYGEVLKDKKYKTAATMAILSARNDDVDEINQGVVDLLDMDTEKFYSSVDSTDNCDNDEEMNQCLLPEYLNTLLPPSFPPHELRLRKFSIVMLIRNLNIRQGLCNGTRLLILKMKNNVLTCKILTGDKRKEIVFINRIIFKCENEYPFTFTRRQFPIKLAFAMTINKSQGQTFNCIAIDLRRNVFTHGQLYVAMSRVRSWSTLKVYLGDHVENSIVENPVFKEMLDTDTQ